MKKINLEKLDRGIMISSYLYLAIPIILLLLSWFRYWISIPLSIALMIATYFAIKQIDKKDASQYKSIFNWKKIVIIVFILIGINLMSGAGAVSYQNWDYNGRNAIMGDLVKHDLPVKYDYSNLPYEKQQFGDKAILNYYFAYWMPSVLVGKIFGFQAASICTLIFQIIGVCLFFYLLFRKMNHVRYRYLLIFLAFGGLNILSHLMFGKFIFEIGVEHIDTSTLPFCMSSFVTQLFWVFNQALPAWIVTMLFMQKKDYKTCGYYFALLLPYAPFPMLGYLYLAFIAIIFGKKLNKLINFDLIKNLFSIPNLLGVISILPIAFMYTLNTSKKGNFLFDAYQNGTLDSLFYIYITYVILEFGVYILLLHKKNWKELLVYFLYFAIVPTFYIGGADLGNRSTIPLLIGLFILVLKEFEDFHWRHGNIKQYFLIICLIIASFTNLNEFYRSFKYTIKNNKEGISNYANNYKTFDEFEKGEVRLFITNFIVSYDEEKPFYKYIVK